jgi:hypothetical protein
MKRCHLVDTGHADSYQPRKTVGDIHRRRRIRSPSSVAAFRRTVALAREPTRTQAPGLTHTDSGTRTQVHGFWHSDSGTWILAHALTHLEFTHWHSGADGAVFETLLNRFWPSSLVRIL